MMWHYGAYGGWDWWWMAGMMLLFWGALVAVAVMAVRLWRGRDDGGALDILRERLARGEITKEQYEQTRQALRR